MAWVFVAANLRSPYLLMVRNSFYWIWLTVGFLALIGLLAGGRRLLIRWKMISLLLSAGLIGGFIAGHGQWLHHQRKHAVKRATIMPELGKHLIVGWLGMEETLELAEKGAIAGVFLTKRDFPPNATISDIRKTVDELQNARIKAGLPRLWIATDQEGGPVAKLSPPLKTQASLGSLLSDLEGSHLRDEPDKAAEILRRVIAYARIQAKELADAGINLNFAPVVDLRPATEPHQLDFHSKIATRALAADPEIVALAGEAYVRVLAEHGITAVIKHFPGLGRVPEDTHHFSAVLDVCLSELDESDWIPFRKISRNTGAGIMLGHVRVPCLDNEKPVSCSSSAVRLLKEEWGFKGMLITDDFSMAPISHSRGGIIRAAKQSMEAGVDLILLSYDVQAVYDLLGEELLRKK